MKRRGTSSESGRQQRVKGNSRLTISHSREVGDFGIHLLLSQLQPARTIPTKAGLSTRRKEYGSC